MLLNDWIWSFVALLAVIAGLDPAIHHLRKALSKSKTLSKRMDARVKPGHDK
jgi:hypothetical protein